MQLQTSVQKVMLCCSLFLKNVGAAIESESLRRLLPGLRTLHSLAIKQRNVCHKAAVPLLDAGYI